MSRRTVEEFIAAIAEPTPTPGGGSAAALVGALSVALSRMVAGLAVGKKGYEAVQGSLRDLDSRGQRIQTRLKELVDEDSRAYDAVVAAMKMPRDTDAARKARVDAMQNGYRRATEVPLETIERCVEALAIAEEAAEKGNRGASTDVGVAVLLAEAAIRGASLNVRVNLASIQDEAFRSRVEAKLEELLGRAQSVGHRAMAIVESRL